MYVCIYIYIYIYIHTHTHTHLIPMCRLHSILLNIVYFSFEKPHDGKCVYTVLRIYVCKHLSYIHIYMRRMSATSKITPSVPTPSYIHMCVSMIYIYIYIYTYTYVYTHMNAHNVLEKKTCIATVHTPSDIHV